MQKIIARQKTTEGLKPNNLSLEARQNAVGVFSVLLKVAKRNPELWKEICREENEEFKKSNYFEN